MPIEMTKVGDFTYVMAEFVMAVNLHSVNPEGEEHSRIYMQKEGIPISIISNWSPATVKNRLEAA